MVEITVAAITGLLALIGTALGTFSGYRLISYRVEQLEKRVEEHNNFARRLPLAEEKLRLLNNRVTALERIKQDEKH